MAHTKLYQNKINQKNIKDKNTNDIQIKLGDKVFLNKETQRKVKVNKFDPFDMINTQDVNITILKDNEPMTITNNRLKLV